MRDKPRLSIWLQDKCLGEAVSWVFISLKLAKDIYKNPSIEHRLAVNCCDKVSDLLECEAGELLHDLG